MTFRPRIKTIAYAVGLAVAQLAVGTAYADTAVGVDTALGNALNPPGRSAIPRPLGADEDVMGTIRRSPTGQLYGVPLLEAERQQSESGWHYTGGVEAGVIGGDAETKSVLFRKYKDLKNGLYLNYFEVEADKPDEAKFMQAFGGGTGMQDQFYGVTYGRYNDWKVRFLYNETVHVFSDNWKSLYDGEGSGNLTLSNYEVPHMYVGANQSGGDTVAVSGDTRGVPDGSYTFAGGTNQACTSAAPCWQYGSTIYSNATALAAIRGLIGTPNATTGAIPALATAGAQSNQSAAINAKLANTDESELSLVRKKAGLRYDKNLDNAWKAYASYSLEQREGSRPFAMNEGNLSTEIAEPIDYQTHEFLTGLSYAKDLNQFNVRASYSKFTNSIDTLNVQYLMLTGVTRNSAINHATFALAPDNDAFNVKAEFGRDLPSFFNGRLTAALSYGSNRQDADLLAPVSAAQSQDLADVGVTTFTGNNVGYTAASAAVNQWNTTDALSQKTADQQIDNLLGNVALNLKPTDKLGVKAEYRYFKTDNKGGYVAYNPLTGQYGRGMSDGNGVTNLDVVVGRGIDPATGQFYAINTAGNCSAPDGFTPVAGCTFGLANTVTNGNNIPVFGQARSTEQTNYVLGATYDLTRSQSVNLAAEREEFTRDFRERAKTWEDKYKLGYVNRALTDSASLRLSYETDSKSGSAYRFRTFEDLGTGLPGLNPEYIIQQAAAGATGYTGAFAANLINRYSYYFRKYDQADRDQEIANARLIMMPREDMDLGLTLQWKDVDYPNSIYGLTKDHQDSATLDVNFQPSAETNLYSFVSYQTANKKMTMNSGVAVGAAAGCTAAGLNVDPIPYYLCSDGDGATETSASNVTAGTRPTSSTWWSDADDTNSTLGLGFQHAFGKVRVGVDYTYGESTTRIGYRYNPTAISTATANQDATNAINAAAGYKLPDITYTQQVLSLNVLIPVDKKWAVRLFDRYEMGTVKDWHYDDVVVGQVAAYDTATLLLDGGPEDYHANVIGALVQYKM